MENVPISVEKAERKRMVCGWLTLFLSLFSSVVWFMILKNFDKMDVIGAILMVSSFSFGLFSAIIFFVGWLPNPEVYKMAHEKFIMAFGEDPTDNRSATQLMVESVLFSMKRGVQGYFERAVGAHRKHELYMSGATAHALAKRRLEASEARTELEDAVKCALDWRYTVPEGIMDFEKK